MERKKVAEIVVSIDNPRKQTSKDATIKREKKRNKNLENYYEECKCVLLRKSLAPKMSNSTNGKNIGHRLICVAKLMLQYCLYILATAAASYSYKYMHSRKTQSSRQAGNAYRPQLKRRRRKAL